MRIENREQGDQGDQGEFLLRTSKERILPDLPDLPVLYSQPIEPERWLNNAFIYDSGAPPQHVAMEPVMTNTFVRLVAGVAFAAVYAASGIIAQQSNLTGTWQMTIVHGKDHGVPIGLELTQDGDKLTGVLHTPHGDKMSLSGTFVNKALQLSSDANDGVTPLKVNGELKEDGTLEGSLSGRMGDMKWTAERLGKPHGS
jgi:hypothetical protein